MTWPLGRKAPRIEHYSMVTEEIIVSRAVAAGPDQPCGNPRLS